METNVENTEKKYWGKKFYESRLNTVLLLILIVLMVFAIKIMLQNKDQYAGVWKYGHTEDVALFNNGLFSFEYDKNVPISIIEKQGDNPNESEEMRIGLGQKNGPYYEVEVSYASSSGWPDEGAGLPLNMNSEGRKSFGDNTYAVFTDVSANWKYFQEYRDGHTVTFLISPEESLPKYINLASLKIK